MEVGDKQIQLINSVKNFLKNLESSNIKSSLSGICYFTAFGETPGYAKLKFWLDGWFSLLNFFKIFLKDVLAIAKYTEYIEVNNRNSVNNYDILVLSWAFKENFQEDGSFQDRYFNENSNKLPNSYWLLISMDDYVPENLSNNITIIKRKKGIFEYNIFSFIKILITTLINCRFSPRKIFHYFSFHSHLAKQLSAPVKKELKKNNYRALLLPYEGQLFQLTSILEAKKINQNITTIGFLPNLLTPLPCDFIHRSGTPDLLLVHGESQIEILNSKLGWPKNKLLLIESLYYRSNKDKSLSKKIFTPYMIHNKDIFINEFKQLLSSSPTNSFPKFDVRIHPPSIWLKAKKHINLKKKLEEIMEIYKDRFSDHPSKKNISIFFGVTAAMFEALEKGIEVIQICSDPVFDSYNEKIWTNLKVQRLSEYTFRYSLILPGKYIFVGNRNRTLHQTIKMLY